MWAPRVMDLERLRQVPGLEQLENRACTAVSEHVHPSLTHLSQVMEPAIEQVSERVYSAVGFDVANATFVVGKDGLVVIDAMLSIENMAAALRAFREISEYPVKGVVYTHSHGDHWGGSPALLTAEQASSGDVAVIAQRQLMAEIARINGFNAPVMAARSAYQFGMFLDCSPEGRINVGAGPFLDQRQAVGLVPPNTLVDDRLELDAEAHRREGLAKHNATWRNWYLTAAAELEGQVPIAVETSFADILSAQPVAAIIAALPVRLRAELTWYIQQTLVLDIGGPEPGAFTLHLRRGVLEVLDSAAGDADATIRFADKAALVDYLAGTALDQLVASDQVKIDGDRDAVARFGTYLDPPPDPSRIMVTLHGPAR